MILNHATLLSLATVCVFYSQSIMWASVSVPTDSVPTTQSPKRGGDYRAMASSQGVLSEGEKREKEGGF